MQPLQDRAERGLIIGVSLVRLSSRTASAVQNYRLWFDIDFCVEGVSIIIRNRDLHVRMVAAGNYECKARILRPSDATG